MSDTPRLIHLDPNGPNGTGLAPLDLDSADFQSALPQQHLHIYYEDPSIGITVGVWDTTTMQEAFGPYPGDEVIVVLEGGFAMLDADENAVGAGRDDCVAFRNAAPMSWKQEGYLKKYFMTLFAPDDATPPLPSAEGGVVVVNPDAPLNQTSATGAPVEREHVAFNNDTGNMSVGIWECETAEFEMESFSIHEFVYVMEGVATITERDGTEHNVKAGDCFFIPKGTECQWQVPTYIKKYYAQINAA